MRSASHPVAGQTLDQAEDGAVEDVGDHAAVVRLFLLLGTKQELSWNGHIQKQTQGFRYSVDFKTVQLFKHAFHHIDCKRSYSHICVIRY